MYLAYITDRESTYHIVCRVHTAHRRYFCTELCRVQSRYISLLHTHPEKLLRRQPMYKVRHAPSPACGTRTRFVCVRVKSQSRVTCLVVVNKKKKKQKLRFSSKRYSYFFIKKDYVA